MSSKTNKSEKKVTLSESYLDLINQFATGLLGKSTVNEIIWNVTNNIISKLGFEDCVIYLLDENREYLVKKAALDQESTNSSESINKISRIKLGEGIVGDVAVTKKAKIINDTSQTDGYIIDQKIRLSEIAVPIVYDDGLIGVIDSEHSEKNFFTSEHLKLLNAIASMTAKKIVQAMRLERLYTRQFHMDLIYNSTHDLLFLIAVEPNDIFRCLSVNEAYLKIINLTRDKVIGKTLNEIWDAERASFFSSKYKKAIASKKPLTYEVIYENIKPQIIVETTITPIFDENGNCINISGISRDVTKNKHAEQAIKESKDQFENLFEYSPNAIFIHDSDIITHVNQAFLDLFGYEKKEAILGKSVLDTIVFSEDHNIIHDVRQRAEKEITITIPAVRLVKGDGTIFISETHATTVQLEGKPHTRVTARDITERKRAEETLLKSEKKYRTLFENSLDGIYKSTPAGKFVEVNPAMVEMLGYASKEELLAIDIKTELYFKEEDRIIMASHQEDQYQIKKKDGSGIWVEDHGYYDYDKEGNIIFHHGILRNVTHKIEKQIELENLLAVTADQNKRLQNFAHIVSHNIRSHTSNMSSLIHFMDVSKDEYERSKLFNMLKTSTDKLEETIMNLNEIITVNQNLQKPKENLNLYDEINNALKVLSGAIREHKISIIVDVPANIIIHVIPAYLDSILLNVLSNAIKYMSPDKESELEIGYKNEGKFSVLLVTDNGIGIDIEKNSNKLFGMYETFHDNEDSRGFGLYITKNQIEAMDGKIEVESTVGEGSTFKIYFHNED